MANGKMEGELSIQFHVKVEVKRRAKRLVSEHIAKSYRDIFEIGLAYLEEGKQK